MSFTTCPFPPHFESNNSLKQEQGTLTKGEGEGGPEAKGTAGRAVDRGKLRGSDQGQA